MEPRIRYAKSTDGVSIAYWAIGEGRPLVYMPPMPWCHIEREWAIPEWRRRYERLAIGRRLIRYDARGFGLSDPNPSDLTPAAHAADLEAVLDALTIEQCDLFAPGDAGMVAIEFCARAAERVGRLVFWGSYANRDRLLSDPKVTSLHALWDEDWFQYTELAIRTILGWKHGARAEQLAEFYRAAATPESVPKVIGALYGIDLTALLPKVDIPALVVALEDCWVDIREEARSLAAGLPNAEFRTVRGETVYFDFFDDADAVVTLVNEFLGGEVAGQVPAAARPGPTAGGLRTVLFTDMVSSTALTQRLGDAAAQEVRRAHNKIVRGALSANSGSEIKHTGDGIMASFGTASSGLDCAIAIQQGVAKHKEDHPDSPLGVYIGLNAGEPIAEDDDLFGTSINLAARICDHAEPGQIVASNVVRELAAGKDFLFSDLGETALRGFDDPGKLWELRWRKQD